jgi:hypothetical protein
MVHTDIDRTFSVTAQSPRLHFTIIMLRHSDRFSVIAQSPAHHNQKVAPPRSIQRLCGGEVMVVVMMKVMVVVMRVLAVLVCGGDGVVVMLALTHVGRELPRC